jgi:nicotinamide-nucleotide amidase
MVIELINTGTELLLGAVLNTHQQWLGRQLAGLGYLVTRQVTVADAAADIEKAVRESLGRADVVITTGGLGPTSDDLTRDQIAQMLGRSVREEPAVLAQITRFFQDRKRPMPERTRVQALVPEGAQVLANPNGTAPGLALHVAPNPFREDARPSWLILLPGPPRELHPMFADAVVPLLRRELPPPPTFACCTLRATGIGESQVEEKVSGALKGLVEAGLEPGYCARPGEVDVRLAARGVEAERLIREAESLVRRQLGRYIYATGEEELEAVIITSLAERRQTLAVAESCTGGCLAHRLTNVPGASAVFVAGFVTYSNQAKEKFLGVQAATLATHGAVSELVAQEMAQGVRKQTGTDYALSVTGIAGPGGATPAKPVGTVFIGLASRAETVVERRFNPWERETFKQVSVQQALDLLRRKVLQRA